MNAIEQKFTNDKTSDLLLLKDIINVIKNYEDKNLDLKITLFEIGCLIGKINYNDQNGNYIRNKYGYVNRSSSNKKQPPGIYFEKLHNLKIVLDNSVIITQFKTELSNDLSNLKDKINYVFYNENDFIATNNIEIQVLNNGKNPDISNIICFVDNHYYEIVLERIKAELTRFDGVELHFSNLIDRYCFARTFIIIGELSHDLNDIDISKNNGICRNLIKIRDALIHNHKRILNYNNDELEEKTNVVINLLKSLHEVITNDKSDLSSFTDNTNKLLSLLQEKNTGTVKRNITKKTPKNENEQLINKIKNCIIRANVTLEENALDIHHKLHKLNEGYQTVLKELNALEQVNYPSVINISEKRTISKLSAEFLDASNQRKTKQDNNKLNEKNQFVIKCMDGIDREISFLIEIEENSQIQQLKKDYVIQHCVSIIGQYMRDMQNQNDTLITEILSNIAMEASVSARKARNEGLAHNIFSFDKKQLIEKMKNDILPAHEHFQSIFAIYKNNNVPLSAITLNLIGASFLKLGYYEKAITYFKQTIKRINEFPNEVKQMKLSACGITQENVTVIDMTKVFFGVEIYSFIAKKNLVHAYLLNENYDDAYNMLKVLISAIDFNSLELATDEFLRDVSEVLNNTAYCLVLQTKYKEAEELLQMTNRLNASDDYIKINLATLYGIQAKYNAAKTLFETVIKNNDAVICFNGLVNYVKVLLNYTHNKEMFPEVDLYIDKIKNLLRNHIGRFKEKYSDKYFLMQIEPINLEIRKITKQIELHSDGHEMNLAQFQLEKLENEINSQLESTGENKVIIEPYAHLSQCFSRYCGVTNNYDTAILCLDKAQFYFDKAVRKQNASFSKLVKDAADCLAKTYSNILDNFKIVTRENRIAYLKKALQIQQLYELNADITLNNLGVEYHQLAEYYYNSQSFDQAVSYYTLAASIIEQSNQSKIKLVESLEILAYSYERAGALHFNIDLMLKAIDRYKRAIELSKGEKNWEKMLEYSMLCKQKLININCTLRERLTKIKRKGKIEMSFTSNEELYSFRCYLKTLSFVNVEQKGEQNILIISLSSPSDSKQKLNKIINALRQINV